MTESDKNVAAGTTGSSPEHNGLPSATNVQRLAEIRARLDAWWGARYLEEDAGLMVEDIAWLLSEVERLEKRVRMYEVVKS